VWGGGQFVAVGENGAIFSSLDGITWTAQTNGVLASDSFYDISWNDSLFVAVGQQNADPYLPIVVTSTDGINWSTEVQPWWASQQSLVWNGSLFVSVGYRSIRSSPDGLAWTTQYGGIDGPIDGLAEIVWTGSQFVAAGDVGSANVFTSPDGVTWTSQRSISGFYTGIASDGNQVVVVNPWGGILTNDAL
jgi:hypothetical protein